MEHIINLNSQTLFSSRTVYFNLKKIEPVERIIKVFIEDNNHPPVILYKSIKGNSIAVEIPNIKEEDFKRFIEILIACTTPSGLTNESNLKELITILNYNDTAIIDFYKNVIRSAELSRDMAETEMDDLLNEFHKPSKKKSWFRF